ncbi:MAG: hypothetical protein WCG97_03230 [bacterium]
MKESPEFRIVGDDTPENKAALVADLNAAFHENTMFGIKPDIQEKIRDQEIEKSELALEVIDYVNKKVDELMMDLGLEAVEFPAENIHILPAQLYSEINGPSSSGQAKQENQAVFVNSDFLRRSPTSGAATMYHEVLHLNGHFAGEMNKDTPHTTFYRKGLVIYPLQAKREQRINTQLEKPWTLFWGLNEAIIQRATRKFNLEILDDIEFEGETKWMKSPEYIEERVKIAEHLGIDPSEIDWISEDRKNYTLDSYPEYRKVYSYVLEEIAKRFPDEYKDTDTVDKEFLKATFTGHMVKIGRLVEKTFGPGSFRTLGNMHSQKPDEPFSAQETMEELKEMRTTFIQHTQK